METRVLARDHSFARRLALARARTFDYVRRRVFSATMLGLGDALGLVIAFALAGTVRHFLFGAAFVQPWMLVMPTIYWAGAVGLGLLPGWGVGAVEEYRRLAWLTVGTFVVAAFGLFLSQQGLDNSRFLMGLAALFAVVTVPLLRNWTKSAMIDAGLWGVPVVIYGAGEMGAAVVRQLREERGLGYVPAAFFDDDESLHGSTVEGVPVVGSMDRVSVEAPFAILAIQNLDMDARRDLLEGPLACYRKAIVIPDLNETPTLWMRSRDLSGMLGLEITYHHISLTRRIAKRAFDLGAVLLTAPLWMPLCALLAVAIWLEDRAHPLYAQERIGQGGRHFRTLKFRTMVPNADVVLKDALASDPALRAEWNANFKLKNDPRITRVGQLLRKTSLDEIPQLFNVLRGEMSLVGPRPLPQYHHGELPASVREVRERVRPGLTGLWQVSGRSDSGNAGMERWDPYYVRNWSLWLDIVILVRTFRAVTKGSGAY
ncbi:MAG: undecaprenyl-phosphate galactose phosphotransferase WbaP [Bacteroidota bacterium]